MTNPREAAIGFEAVKVSMSQTKDGIKLTLVIHPQDHLHDLFSHPVGTRYQVALVQVDDQGEPVEPKAKTEGERAVASAAMLCKNHDFIQWMMENGYSLVGSEEETAKNLCRLCEITSRSELRTNSKARDMFHYIKDCFMAGRPLK